MTLFNPALTHVPRLNPHPKAQPHKCSLCDNTYTQFQWDHKPFGPIMQENLWCYQCAYWNYYASNQDTWEENRIWMVDYQLIILGKDPVSIACPLGNRKFVFENMKTKEHFESTNVWPLGSVPERWRHLFTNTAKLIECTPARGS